MENDELKLKQAFLRNKAKAASDNELKLEAIDWFELAASIAVARQRVESCDYRNPEDGLLYCGKCHTPKEAKIEFSGEARQLPIVCKCQREKAEAQERQEQEQREQELISKLRKQSLMDKKFDSQTFENFEVTPQNQKVLRLCKRYADGFDEMQQKNQGLLLYGDVGTGKSFAAACIANALLAKHVPVIMTSFVKLLEQMKIFNADEDELIWKLNQAKLLILDDLGAERDTDYALERVYDIVDSRYRASRPMIITTNLGFEDMMNTTDIRRSRIYDRIFEACYPIKFDGKSYRKANAGLKFDEMRRFLEG